MRIYVFLCKLICKFRTIGLFVPDRLFVKSLYFLDRGKKLNLAAPQLFTEKIQWLKLYDRNPLYHIMVDKERVKTYVANIIGEQYIIRTLRVWDRVEDIDIADLPDRFVLKTTNGGGSTGVVICTEKKTFNIDSAKNKLQWSLDFDIYQKMGEWAYKGVSKKIIAEEYIEPEKGEKELSDFKWYCFNGVPTYCQVIKNRSADETIDFYDSNWNHQEFIGLNTKAKHAEKLEVKPQKLDEHLMIASKLSRNIPFSRIDLYEINGKVYFGEITFYAASGFGSFSPQKWDMKLGNLLKLPKIK